MRMMRFGFLAVLALSACGGSDDTSLVERVSASNKTSPDEFAVLPQKPLVLPESLDELPPPTPGAGNRTDLTPRADMIAALTGRTGLAAPVASDGALISALSRAGVTPDIRSVVRAEDAEFRRRNRGLLLERVFDKDTEYLIYRRQRLDPETEAARLRRQGLQVPPVPPR
ncbi:DUF3035 domain-containing protein [Algicella marina]|uniref:DUF3035 domain-containing protein n=1 Tax=Algicella marina TaxID=2683284 RepID=A0A6P1T6N5_9RHOB|nr:DUF3035 domain-containing protein [Algicella marina]QHQ37415.1 DUF3035 domain-containing protein [Algicella marina]